MTKSIFGRSVLLVWLLLTAQLVFAQQKNITFHTQYGDIKVELFDFTPHHRDLMLQAIEDSVYQGALFNRIIKDFVVQGGEHDRDIAARERLYPNLPKRRLAAEFDDRAYHQIGALGAGRDDNPDKASFLNQLYFVVGKPVTSVELDVLEKKKGILFTAEQRTKYLNKGGLPRLDKDYTVFGQIKEGLDVILKISHLPTDAQDYPLEKVAFTITVDK